MTGAEPDGAAEPLVGLVIVSHSAKVSEGTVDLAAQMAGDEVRIVAAGGLADGAIGAVIGHEMTHGFEDRCWHVGEIGQIADGGHPCPPSSPSP